MTTTYHQETLALHSNYEGEDCAIPIHRTAAFNFETSLRASNLFNLKELGNIYTRLTNTTNDILEKRLAAIEGGIAALSFGSGTAAIYFTITNIAKMGDEIISANNLYGGTFTQFDAILPQQGINVIFTQINDFQAVENAINEKTRAIYIESIGNPSLDVADIEQYAKIAQKYHLPLIVDATFTPPTLLNPIKHGANIVIHSLSKWINGHGTGIGGIVIDAGTFDWSDPKFSLYNEPDRGYHGLIFAHDLGELTPLAFILRLRLVGLRNQGATLSPDNAWLFLQGLETLSLRMNKHSQNALKVAEFLQNHPKVSWVRYPGLPQDASYQIALKYLKNGFGGMIVFGIKGTIEDAIKLTNNIKLFSIVANVGDAKSLIIHPASTTHSQLSPEDQDKSGLPPELIRLSIGIEHPNDIIQALSNALDLI